MDGRTPQARRNFQETYRWVHAADQDGVFAYDNVCDTLGLEPGLLRRWLKSLHDVELALPRARTLNRCSLPPSSAKTPSWSAWNHLYGLESGDLKDLLAGLRGLAESADFGNMVIWQRVGLQTSGRPDPRSNGWEGMLVGFYPWRRGRSVNCRTRRSFQSQAVAQMGVLDSGFHAGARRGIRCSARALSARPLAQVLQPAYR